MSSVPDAQDRLNSPHDHFLISNRSLPQATLAAPGGFNEKLPAGEDYELGLRLWKMGIEDNICSEPHNPPP